MSLRILVLPPFGLGLAIGAGCRGSDGAVDDTTDTDTDPVVECVAPPDLAQQTALVDRACAAEFVCRGLPGERTDRTFLSDCLPRRTRALQACLRTESALACLENVRRDQNCAGLESEPCKKVFECDAR
jgi:hypothetical protein